MEWFEAAPQNSPHTFQPERGLRENCGPATEPDAASVMAVQMEPAVSATVPNHTLYRMSHWKEILKKITSLSYWIRNTEM